MEFESDLSRSCGWVGAVGVELESAVSSRGFLLFALPLLLLLHKRNTITRIVLTMRRMTPETETKEIITGFKIPGCKSSPSERRFSVDPLLPSVVNVGSR